MFVETEPQPPCLELPFNSPTKLPKQITAGCHACTITVGATLKTAEQRGPGDQRSCAELNNSPKRNMTPTNTHKWSLRDTASHEPKLRKIHALGFLAFQTTSPPGQSTIGRHVRGNLEPKPKPTP
jgi:hypothetical protein